jgi:hypothetical protein
VEIIGHLVNGLNDYLNADSSERDSEADTEVSDATAAGVDRPLQGGLLQGDAQALSAPTSLEGKLGEVTEKDIQELFVFDEEKMGTLSAEEKAPFEVSELKEDREWQSGNTGNGAGAPTDEKLPSPYLAHATSPSLPPASAPLDPSGLKEAAGKYGDTGAPGRTESSSLLDAPSLISADSKDKGISKGCHAD